MVTASEKILEENMVRGRSEADSAPTGIVRGKNKRTLAAGTSREEEVEGLGGKGIVTRRIL